MVLGIIFIIISIVLIVASIWLSCVEEDGLPVAIIGGIIGILVLICGINLCEESEPQVHSQNIVYCIRCGDSIEENYTYCPDCGTKIVYPE